MCFPPLNSVNSLLYVISWLHFNGIGINLVRALLFLYMSLHINLNIDQYKISPIIFRILIRCTFKLYIYYALSPEKCIGCNDMFPADYGDHENDAHLSDSTGIAKINLNSISSKQLISSALYTSSLLLYTTSSACATTKTQVHWSSLNTHHLYHTL